MELEEAVVYEETGWKAEGASDGSCSGEEEGNGAKKVEERKEVECAVGAQVDDEPIDGTQEDQRWKKAELGKQTRVFEPGDEEENTGMDGVELENQQNKNCWNTNGS
jgi:hypothetical protein